MHSSTNYILWQKQRGQNWVLPTLGTDAYTRLYLLLYDGTLTESESELIYKICSAMNWQPESIIVAPIDHKDEILARKQLNPICIVLFSRDWSQTSQLSLEPTGIELDCPLLKTYHPGALMARPALKKDLWEALQQLKDLI